MTHKTHDCSTRLALSLGPLALKSPLIAASGTCGYGAELAELGVSHALGALVTKTITRAPRMGNPPPRVCETPAGMLNSIGLANPGFQVFTTDILPTLGDLGCPCVVNIGGATVDEFVELAAALADAPQPAALELNLSCPNVTAGGLDLSRTPDALGEVTRAVRAVWTRPLWVKLTPNVGDITTIVHAAADCGADAVVVANTYLGMVVDWRARRSRIGRPMGGLSGPAIKPLSLRLAWQAASTGAVPVIACGGVSTAEDVLEYFVVGASAVQIGSTLFRDPYGPHQIVAALDELLAREGIESIEELKGAFTR